MATTIGSHLLLQQRTTNPVHNAIVHNLPERGNERIRTDHAGVGLGLAIVKTIAEAHDGTLTLTPRAGGGLCVTVQLPVAPPGPGSP